MKTWLITGTSRGLGAELARQVVDRGDNLVATARNSAALAEAYGAHERVHAISLDVRDTDAVDRAVADSLARFGQLDVVVNNAGLGLAGAIEEASDDEARQLFDTNFFGALNVIRAVLPSMRAQGSGRIVNVGSYLGLRGGAGMGMYCATKFALEGLTESLSEEVAGFGLQVMIAELGAVRTEFLTSATMSLPQEAIAAYEGTPARAVAEGMGGWSGSQPGDARKVAALIYDAATSTTMPLHLPIGPDAVAVVEQLPEQFKAPLATWRSAAMSTSHGEPSGD